MSFHGDVLGIFLNQEQEGTVVFLVYQKNKKQIKLGREQSLITSKQMIAWIPDAALLPFSARPINKR